MCGIVGFWRKDPLTETHIRLGRQATEALRHRGPDGTRFWFDRPKGLFLGHTRLAVIDLSADADQPMEREDDLLVFNGEIYNYTALRAELKDLGASFISTGDSEVLLRAWQFWQEKALDRFDGMFAFALFQNQTLHLATDPFGEKPLYAAHTEDGFFFASEPTALNILLEEKPSLDEQSLAFFLCMGFLPPQQSGYPSIQRIPPATYIRATPESFVQKRYWQLEPVSKTSVSKPLDEAALDAIEAAFTESLRRRVHADVPLGLFLSSGLDSSLIAAIAAKRLNTCLDTYTVAFRGSTDESERAAAIASHLGLPHRKVDSEAMPTMNGISDLYALYGEPNDNLTALAVHQMASAAKPYLTVALTGTGGDELFYGYGRYQHLHRFRHLVNAPKPLKQLAALVLSLPARFLPQTRILEMLCGKPESLLIALRNHPVGKHLQSLPAYESLLHAYFDDAQKPYLDWVHAKDLDLTLPFSYISSMDRGSMRAGVEVRTPFLNRDLWQTVRRYGSTAQVAYGQKCVVRRLLSRYLPGRLIGQKKQGFVFPESRVFAAQSCPKTTSLDLGLFNAEYAWTKRHDRGWRKLAIRLLIIEHLMGESNQGIS